eukprot:9238808-Pyramimonas_sp.AAC.1
MQARALRHGLQWKPVRKKPSTRNPTLSSRTSIDFWCGNATLSILSKTIETQETQGTGEASRGVSWHGPPLQERGRDPVARPVADIGRTGACGIGPL